MQKNFDIFDIIVIGKGLIGSAAFRYLSAANPNVALIGPDEPPDYAAHDGVFASHYDQGRLTHRLSKDLTWAHMTERAMANYVVIEEQSGIRFYMPCGGLAVASGSAFDELSERCCTIGQALEIPYERLIGSEAIAQHFPMFAFPAGFDAIYEAAPAGCVNPRNLVRAQVAIGEQQGGRHIRQEVTALHQQDDCVQISTRAGQHYRAERVLIATGAFANCYNVLPKAIALRVKSETTILAEVSAETATRLSAMPTLIYTIESSVLDGIYLAPPLPYPDGRIYIKLGCDTATDETLTDLPAIQRWMKEGRNDGMGAAILAALRSFMPDLPILSWRTQQCVVCYTPHRLPFVDQIGERLFLATGGNGSSAKCSDTLGWLAANLLLGQPWPPEFRRSQFKVRWREG
jgi:sarcosine oxidase